MRNPHMVLISSIIIFAFSITVLFFVAQNGWVASLWVGIGYFATPSLITAPCGKLPPIVEEFKDPKAIAKIALFGIALWHMYLLVWLAPQLLPKLFDEEN